MPNRIMVTATEYVWLFASEVLVEFKGGVDDH